MKKGMSGLLMFIIAIVIFAVLATAVFVLPNKINSNVVSNNLSLVASISAEQLGQHNSEDNCWVVYKGKVYDLTLWLPKHPGGAKAISPYCGNLGFEDAFTKKHGATKASFFLQIAKLMGDFKEKGTLS
jgi:hypothetical protein